MYLKFTYYNSGHRAPWVRVKVKSKPSSKAKTQALLLRIVYYKNDDETVPMNKLWMSTTKRTKMDPHAKTKSMEERHICM